ARTRKVRADHRLNSDRKSNVEVVESLCRAVRDRAVGPKRCVALVASFNEALFTADVKDRVLLARKACVRKVFGRRRRTNSDLECAFSDTVAEPRVALDYRLLYRLRERRFEHQTASFGTDTGELVEVVDIEAF